MHNLPVLIPAIRPLPGHLRPVVGRARVLGPARVTARAVLAGVLA